MLVVSGYYQLLTTNTTNKKIILNLKFEFYKKDNKKFTVLLKNITLTKFQTECCSKLNR